MLQLATPCSLWTRCHIATRRFCGADNDGELWVPASLQAQRSIGGTKTVRNVSNKVLWCVVGVIGVLLLVHIGIDAFLFYLDRIEFDVTIPVALGVQVSLASLMFVVVSLSLVFFGISRLGDIEAKAVLEARRVARRAAQDVARREGKVQWAGKVAGSDEAERLSGEEEREVQ